MAAVGIMLTPTSLSKHMPSRGRFHGDGDDLVDALTEACKKPAVTSPVIERMLVPFFDENPDVSMNFAPLESKRSKSGGKPGKKDVAKPESSSTPHAPKHRREPTPKPAESAPRPGATSRTGNRSPPRKRQEASNGKAIDTTPGRKRTPVLPPVDRSVYAGPGFTNSPLPETLPLPTPSLLLMEGLRQQLVL